MIKHPVLELVEESNLTLEHLKPPKIEKLNLKCAICPKGNAPTQSIDGSKVEKLKKMVTLQGYTAVLDDAENAGWVIGVENEQLFNAATKGVRTTLIPTGLGTDLYKKMFPSAEIMGCEHI